VRSIFPITYGIYIVEIILKIESIIQNFIFNIFIFLFDSIYAVVKMGDEHIIKNIPAELTREEKIVVLSLLRNGKITDDKLKEKLNLKSSNAARHHRKKVEEKGIIRGYRAIVDMGKIGFPVKFMVIVEMENQKEALEVMKIHAHSASLYLKEFGDVCIIPIGKEGAVLFERIMNAGEKSTGVIIAHATDYNTANLYANMYLTEMYPNIKTKLFVIFGETIKDFLINKEFLNSNISVVPSSELTKKTLKKYREFFAKIKG